jgi:hypothetical protein
MSRNRMGSASFAIKAICFAMAFMIAGSVLASGLSAAAGCGPQWRCCCQSVSLHMQPNAPKQMRSSVNCFSGAPLKACDLQAGRSYDLPQVIPASFRGLHPAGIGLAAAINDSIGGGHDSGGNDLFQLIDRTFKSPPLYLTHHCYII